MKHVLFARLVGPNRRHDVVVVVVVVVVVGSMPACLYVTHVVSHRPGAVPGLARALGQEGLLLLRLQQELSGALGGRPSLRGE